MLKVSGFFRSVAWVSSSLVVAQGLRLVQAVIVARWLGPTEMGLYAYVYSVLTLVDLLRAIGAEQVYIARSPSEPEAEREWLAGCWNARLVLACLVSLLMFLGGLGVSQIEGEERLGLLLMMLSLLSPLIALRSAKLIHQQKVQNFGPLSRFEMIAAVLQSLLPLAVVYFFRSVEALVLANLGAAVFAAALSHIMFPMRFSFRLPPALQEELLFYGKNNIVISVLTTLHTNLDNFAIGSFIGRAALGFYSTGYRLGTAPSIFLQPIANRLLLPQYRLALDRSFKELSKRWRTAFQFLCLCYATIAASVIIFADLIVQILLGPEWSATTNVLVLTAFITYLRGITAATALLMIALRELHLEARLKALDVAVFGGFVACGVVSQDINVMLIGGILSYFGAFVSRSIWWNRQLLRAEVTGLSIRHFVAPVVGLVALLGSAALREIGVHPAWSLTLLFLCFAGPLIFTMRKLAAEFEQTIVSLHGSPRT